METIQEKTRKIKTLDIVAKEWFDSFNGNSYFSCYITVNFSMKDEANFYLPFQYGYGDQYEYEAFKVLMRHNYIDPVYNAYLSPWTYYRDNKIIVRKRKLENCKKTEL